MEENLTNGSSTSEKYISFKKKNKILLGWRSFPPIVSADVSAMGTTTLFAGVISG